MFGFLGPNGAGQDDDDPGPHGLPPAQRRASHDLRPRLLARRTAARIATLAFAGSEPGYLGELPAGEQLDFLGRLRGLDRRAWRPLAERLELDPTVPIKKLSRGNRQKVARDPGVHGPRAAAGHGRADDRPRSGDAARVPGPRRRGPRRRAGRSSCRPTTCPRSSAAATASACCARVASSTSRRSRRCSPRTGAPSTSSSARSRRRTPSRCRTSASSRSSARRSTSWSGAR